MKIYIEILCRSIRPIDYIASNISAFNNFMKYGEPRITIDGSQIVIELKLDSTKSIGITSTYYVLHSKNEQEAMYLNKNSFELTCINVNKEGETSIQFSHTETPLGDYE